MSAGLAREIASAREHSDKGGARTYLRRFLVETTSRTDDQSVVLTSGGLPRLFFPFTTETSTDPVSLCVERVVRQIRGSNTLWHVDCRYTTDTEESKPDEDPDNPFLDDPTFELTFQRYQQLPSGTINQTTKEDSVFGSGQKLQNAFINSAGEPFENMGALPNIDSSRPVLVIERNEPFLNIPLIIEYQDAVNSDHFFGASPRQCKVGIRANSDRRGDTKFFTFRYEISFKRETWDVQMLNKGHFSVDGSGDRTIFRFNRNVSAGGFGEAGRVALLDKDGDSELGEGIIPSWKRFKVYRERPFALLNLPAFLAPS